MTGVPQNIGRLGGEMVNGEHAAYKLVSQQFLIAVVFGFRIPRRKPSNDIHDVECGQPADVAQTKVPPQFPTPPRSIS